MKTKEYCRSCGSLCVEKLKKIQVTYDRKTGERQEEHFTEIVCPKLRWWYNVFGSFGVAHTGQNIDPFY